MIDFLITLHFLDKIYDINWSRLKRVGYLLDTQTNDYLANTFYL